MGQWSNFKVTVFVVVRKLDDYKLYSKVVTNNPQDRMISLAASLLTLNFIPSFWLDKDESAALFRTIYGQDLVRSKGEPVQGINALASFN